jgi:hypothetical protein
VVLHLRIKKIDPAITRKEEERELYSRKLIEDFQRLSDATNKCFELAKVSTDQLPSIRNNFAELTSRVASIEKNFIIILQEHEARNKFLMDTLTNHTIKSADTLEKMQEEAIVLMDKESKRANDEASEIVSSMSKSLDDITKAIENSFAPFLESVTNLSLIDTKTSISIDRMTEAAELFVKISEPQARLASEAAILIEESVANIRSIASRSLSILELELKTVIDSAVSKLQEVSAK